MTYWSENLTEEQARELAKHDQPIFLHPDQEQVLGQVKHITFEVEFLIAENERLRKENKNLQQECERLAQTLEDRQS